MNRARRLACGAVFVVAAAARAAAQGEPHAGYVHPAGGERGTVLEIVVGGQRLDGAREVLVSGGGVTGSVIEHEKPLTPAQRSELRDKLRQLRAEGAAAKADPLLFQGRDLRAMSREELAAWREKLARDPRRPPNPQIAETVRLHVALAPDADPGPRELRLVAAAGVTNPLRFHVGTWPEVREEEPNEGAAATPLGAARPIVANGQILPGDADRFRFAGRAGESLVVAAQARELIPYLADAVPGWFQAVLTLRDGNGTELAYVDDWRFDPDPLLRCVLPADGDYVLEIRDALWRGREDFVYRITLGELPFATCAFPLGGLAGAGPSAARAECTEAASAGDVLTLAPPVTVNGRIDRPGDEDVFRFGGQAGETLVAEVEARRLGSPLDSLLWVTDVAGRELARNDDHPDLAAGLTTHQADSRLEIAVPADGDYLLHLADAQHQGSEAHAYRLRLGPPRPDFVLLATPSGINVRAGGTAAFTVHVVRRDGFAGAVDLALVDAPAGFVLSGGHVPAGRDEVRVTLSAPEAARACPVPLALEGTARIEGREVRRRAAPADDRTQAFLYRHLVPAAEFLAAVTARGPRVSFRFSPDSPVRIAPGGTAELRLPGPRRGAPGALRFVLDDPPAGITLEEVRTRRAETTLLLRAGADLEPGGEENLIVAVLLERTVTPEGGGAARTRLVPLGILPAVRLEIAAR
ncbi:MAG: hypothetical protein AB1726_04460 [Planctomycetota bacterium]